MPASAPTSAGFHDSSTVPPVTVKIPIRNGGAIAGVVRLVQTGHLYWYALVMILGVFGLMTWQLWPYLHSLLSIAH